MHDIIRSRLRQGMRTLAYPDGPATLPDRFRGVPVVADAARCAADCRRCVQACPTGALAGEPGALRVDLGRCLFCTDCAAACPRGAISHQRDHRLSAGRRQDLTVPADAPVNQAAIARPEIVKMFGRSLKLRQVSAGGCNGCEPDVNVLNTVVFDLGRFGIQFVASPRHADGLLVTGPVTENMKRALEKTWAAVPGPKVVIAVGACAVSGGPYLGHPQVHNGADSVLPVDLYIPGCPPHPLTILDGLLKLAGKIGPSR